MRDQDFLDALIGPVDDQAEGVPQGRQSLACLAIGEPKGRHELETTAKYMAEIMAAGLDTVEFLGEDDDGNEVSLGGARTPEQNAKAAEIEQRWAGAIEAARLLDQ